MSELEINKLKQPAARLTTKEFFKEMLKKTDDNHTTIFLKHFKMEKDLAELKERLLMHEGAVAYLNKFMQEWEIYEKDTKNLHKRQMEEQNKIAAIKENLQEAAKEKKKLKRKKKRG